MNDASFWKAVDFKFEIVSKYYQTLLFPYKDFLKVNNFFLLKLNLLNLSLSRFFSKSSPIYQGVTPV